MTRLFINLRRVAHAFLFIFTLVVLGVAAALANNFLSSELHLVPKGIIIYSLVITAATILLLIFLTSYSQPRTEMFIFFLLAIGWVAEAAWATDVIGNQHCEMIPSSSQLDTKDGYMSARSWCYLMKTIEAFSWTNFALFTLFLILLISLTTRAHGMGRPEIWREPIADLPWYGQYPGYEQDPSRPQSYAYGYPGGPGTAGMPASTPGGYPNGFYPMMAQPSGQFPQGGYIVQQQPGHSVVIQPGQNGQHTVSQVPGLIQQ